MMNGKIKEHCIYCGGEVYYTGMETLIKCKMCGHTLVVAKFENELARMNQALEEGEAAKRALEMAEKEKKAADARLLGVLNALDEMRSLKDYSETSFAEIAKAFEDSKDQQEAMMTLMQSMGSGLKDGQNAGLRAIQAVASSQKDSSARLNMLQGLSDKILKSQDDILAKLQMQTEIVAQLNTIEMAADQRQKLMTDFVLWAQTSRKEDYECLKNIESSAAVLLRGQKFIADKVGQLQQMADRTQKTLEDFQGQYTRDKLEELRGLYHQAENFQHDQDYEQAEDYYRQVIVKGGGDAEVCWRLILCHYCISYQQDDEGRFIPIILNPDLSDPEDMSIRKEFQPYLEADKSGIYKAELSRIDRILDKYRELRDDVHYDIFISVKQSGPDDHPTLDSDKAYDLYYHLKDMGFKVFNSRACKAELVAAGEYEPYIIAALMSSRVLIVLGTNADNMNAQWVKNEWSRFQWLMKKEADISGHTDRVLLCYLAGEMRPNEIPKALNRRRQAITEGPTTDQQLARVLNPLLKQERISNSLESSRSADSQKYEQVNFKTAEESPSQVLTQMTVWLFTGHYESVLDKYNKLMMAGRFLDQPQLHIYALCAEKKVEELGQLVESDIDLSKEGLFKLARKFSKGTDLADELAGCLEANKAWRNKHQKSSETATNAEPVKQQPPTADGWCEAGKDDHQKEKIRRSLEVLEEKKKAPAEDETPEQYYKKGMDYLNGQTVPKSAKNAVECLKKAALSGHVKAQFTLGEMYEKGEGVWNIEEAKKYYKMASDQGYYEAHKALNRINSQGGTKTLTVSSADKVYAARKAVTTGVKTPEADSWEEIIKNIRNNTYREKYKIGYTKTLDLGAEGIITMRLVAFDTDQPTFGKNKAATTWIADQALSSLRGMNDKNPYLPMLNRGSKGGWERCKLRAYLQGDFKALLPDIVRASIKEVVKYTNGFDENGIRKDNMKTSDSIWIPSGKEVGASGDSLGPCYDILCKGKNNIRIKRQTGTGAPVWWWLRSAYDNKLSFDRISDTGAASSGPAERESGVVIGFCI